MMLGFAILIAAMLGILVHELGHLVAARSVGLPAVGLTMQLVCVGDAEQEICVRHLKR